MAKGSSGPETIYRFIAAQIARHKDYSWRHYLPRAKAKRGWRGRRGGSSALHISKRIPIAQRPPKSWTVLFPAIGKPISCSSPNTARPSWPCTSDPRACSSPQSPPAKRPCRSRTSYPACSSRYPPNCADPSPSTTAPSCPALRTASPRHRDLLLRPLRALAKGRHTRTPSDACDAPSRARPTWPTLSDRQLSALVCAYNNTPRKCLDWNSPARGLPGQTVCTSNENPPARLRGHDSRYWVADHTPNGTILFAAS